MLKFLTQALYFTDSLRKHKDFELPLLLETLPQFGHTENGTSIMDTKHFSAGKCRTFQWSVHNQTICNIPNSISNSSLIARFSTKLRLSTIATEAATFWEILYYISLFNPSTLHSSNLSLTFTTAIQRMLLVYQFNIFRINQKLQSTAELKILQQPYMEIL